MFLFNYRYSFENSENQIYINSLFMEKIGVIMLTVNILYTLYMVYILNIYLWYIPNILCRMLDFIRCLENSNLRYTTKILIYM